MIRFGAEGRGREEALWGSEGNRAWGCGAGRAGGRQGYSDILGRIGLGRDEMVRVGRRRLRVGLEVP